KAESPKPRAQSPKGPREFFSGPLDNMERPTSALQGAGYAARGPLNAEPHTKEVGRDEVYNHHRLRSARGDHSGRGTVARPPNTSPAPADVRQFHDSALRG